MGIRRCRYVLHELIAVCAGILRAADFDLRSRGIRTVEIYLPWKQGNSDKFCVCHGNSDHDDRASAVRHSGKHGNSEQRICQQDYADLLIYRNQHSIHGCPPTKTFWKIMFPMAQSGLVTVTIFNFINIWNEYFLSLIFANNDALRPVAVGLYGMLQSMQYTGNWSGMFAAVIIVFLPTFILYIFLSEKIIGGVTGGIKG